MTRRNSIPILAVLVALTFVSAGCGKKEQAPSPPPPPQKASPAPKAQPPVQGRATSAAIAPVAGLSQYDFTNRRDPFKPFLQAKAPEKTRAVRGSSAGLLPVQSYNVEQFRISGIIVGLKESKALIVDPAGKGYVVKEGMSIGANNGVITKIAPSYLEVSERYTDDFGKVRKRTVKLSLAKKQ